MDGERLDLLNMGSWAVYQNSSLFCFGIDAVLLASLSEVTPDDSYIDLCSGSGVIPFLMLARGRSERATAVEYFEYQCALMRKSAEYNGCADRLNIVNADIKDIKSHLSRSSFDVVTVNPPYEKDGHGLPSENEMKNAARREVLCDINDVADASAYLLRENGRLFMVHRPSRLCDIMCALRKARLEPRTLRFVSPRAESAPNLVIIKAVKGANPGLTVEKPLYVYNGDGSYTDECAKCYKEEE